MPPKQRKTSTVCPRVPDWIGIVGDHVVFVLEDRAFFRSPGGAMTDVALDDTVAAVAIGPNGVAMVCGELLGRYSSGGVAVDATDYAEMDWVRVAPGWDGVLGISAPGHQLVLVDPPRELPIPEGASRARFAAPFASGTGMVWIDLEQVYRLRGAGMPSALGRANKAQALVVGPDGALVVQLEKDTLLASPRGVAVRLGATIDADSTRFSPDGMRALALDEDGVVLLDLAAGKELSRWDGDYLPLGFAPEPVLLDGASGAIVRADGTPLVQSFCPPLEN